MATNKALFVVSQQGDLHTEAAEELNLHPGDMFVATRTDDDLVLTPIPADQAGFWTREWQEKEREAAEEIAAGQGILCGSDEEFLSSLDAIRNSTEF